MTEKSNQSLTKRGFNLPNVFSGTLIVLLLVFAVVLFCNWLEIHYSMLDSYSWFLFGNRGYDTTIILISGFVVALSQFRFLHKKSKCISMFSLGESRKRLFDKKVWFPLFSMVVITLLYYSAILASNIEIGRFNSMLIDEFFANVFCSLMLLVFGYTVGVLSCLFTGKFSEAVVFGVSASALPVSVFLFIDAVMCTFLRGYGPSNYWFSNYTQNEGNPLTTILSVLDPLYILNTGNISLYDNVEMSDYEWMYTPVYHIIKSIVFIVVCVVGIMLLKHYFSKKYKVENCDKQAKNKIVAVICSTTLALLVCDCAALCFDNIIDQNTVFHVKTLTLMICFFVLLVIISAVVAVIINLSLYRTKKMIKFALGSVSVIAAFNAILLIITFLGGFGFTQYTPETDKIKSVMINDDIGVLPHVYSDYLEDVELDGIISISFKNKEDIEKIKEIHKFIAKDKNADTTDTFSIIYELENGEFIYRSYPFLSNEACQKISTLFETETIRDFYKTILNQSSEMNSKNSDKEWFGWEKEIKFNNNWDYVANLSEYYPVYDEHDYEIDYNTLESIACADSLVVFSKDNIETHITNQQVSEETIERLKKALYKDFKNMSVEEYFNPEKQFGVISFATHSILRDFYVEYLGNEDEPTHEQLLQRYGDYLHKFSVTSDMVNTIKALKDAGLYKYLEEKKEIQYAHVLDSQKLIIWQNQERDATLRKISGKQNLFSATIFSWEEDRLDDYLEFGCCYVNRVSYEEGGYCGTDYDDVFFDPIPESDIQKITPEEAAKLREKAFMTYNAGNDCKFLVMKYTDGTANMLVIPE